MAMKISKKAQKGINRGVALGYTGVESSIARGGVEKVERPSIGLFAESDFAWNVLGMLLTKGRTMEEAQDKARKIVTGGEKEENLPAIIKFIGGDNEFWIEGLKPEYPTIEELLAKPEVKTRKQEKEDWMVRFEALQESRRKASERRSEENFQRTIRNLKWKEEQRQKAKEARWENNKDKIMSDFQRAGFKVKGL